MATVTTKSLREAILDLGKGMFSKQLTYQLLDCVLISFKNDSIVFTVTDLTVVLKIKIESYNNLPEGQYSSVVIAYQSLLNLSKDMVGSKEITLKSYNFDLEVEYGTTNYFILGAKEEFPELNAPSSENLRGQVCINRNQFKEAVDLCRQYVCEDSTKHVLTGINLRIENNEAMAEATDGHFMIQADFPVQSKDTFNFVVPAFFPKKLLKQKWEKLTITTYHAPNDHILAIDETGRMEFQTLKIDGKYPSQGMDGEFRGTMTAPELVVSTVDPNDLLCALDDFDDSYEFVTLICENKNIHVHAIDSDKTEKQASITRSGTGFGYASLCRKQLPKVCTVSKAVKEMVIYIGKARPKKRLLPVVIKYSSPTQECSFTIGMGQIDVGERTPEYKSQKALVNLYSQVLESAEAESRIDCNDEGIFDVTEDLFPKDFFNPQVAGD